MSRTEMLFSQNPKSKLHLTIQKTLLSLHPKAKLEYRFPSLKRVADAVLLSQKIIFEIQYSPISLQEVQNCIQDYESLGFTVIWILHHQTFNRDIASPAELYLRRHIAYFTSITPLGLGFFYDQLEFFEGTRRIYKGPPLIIYNLLPRSLLKIPKTFLKTLKEKFKHCSFYLPGDLTDHLLQTPHSNWAQVLEKNYSPSLFKKFLSLSRDFFLYQLYLNASHRSTSARKHAAKQNKETPLNKVQNIPPL